jgi:hypothetical protein
MLGIQSGLQEIVNYQLKFSLVHLVFVENVGWALKIESCFGFCECVECLRLVELVHCLAHGYALLFHQLVNHVAREGFYQKSLFAHSRFSSSSACSVPKSIE